MRRAPLLLICVLGLLPTACNTEPSKYKDALVGRWDGNAGGIPVFFEFDAGGKASMSGIAGTYKTDSDDTIWISTDQAVNGMKKFKTKIVSLENNVLTLRDPDGTTLTLRKRGAAPGPNPGLPGVPPG